MPELETTRGTLWYADARKPGKTPLLLIHGAGASHLDYPPVLRRSSQGSIAPDLNGHGKSPGDGHSSITAYAQDMIALLDALNIESVIVAGHSMGGAIAMTLALQYPERVAGMILIATGAKLVVNDLILNGIVDDTEKTARLIVKWSWAKHMPDDIREQALARLLATNPKITQQDFVACNNFDVRDKLSEITVPTLILGGTLDKMTPPAWSDFMAEHIPAATLKIIEDAGHMLPLEQPEQFARHVETWLGDLPKTITDA